MKKILALFLAFLCIVGTSCGRSMNNVIEKEQNFTGIVAEVKDSYIMVNVSEDDPLYSSCNIMIISLHEELKECYMNFFVGDEVVVYYDGLIRETDPPSVNRVHAIILKTP
ncbi:MAG: hypothetical protein IJA35_07215 [Clostridia bacterium]|nr:hypothetical protein [Clostridia bacterium]